VSILHAFILGIVQGLTEFIPVSSSGHLQLVPFVVGWKEPTVAFDVAVHLGTLLAVAYVFREEIVLLVRTALSWKTAAEDDRRLLRMIVIATVPAAVVGAVLNSRIEDVFQRPVAISFLLGVTGYFLLSSETALERREETRDEASLKDPDAGIIGVAQAVAILPGISRSGATIGAGLHRGLSRPAAARFSFLLSIPIIAGAVIFKIPDMVHKGFSGNGPAFLVGIATSAVVGFYVIVWFLHLVRHRSLRPFGVYCFIAMTVGLLTALARG